MNPCRYSDFVTVLKNSPHSFPREFIILATKNIDCRIAFFVYLLLLDLAVKPGVEANTICVAQRELAEYLKVSLRTVKRAIAFLKKNGYIATTRDNPGKGGYQLNKIQVLFPEDFMQNLLQAINNPSQNQNSLTPHPEPIALHPLSLIQENLYGNQTHL